MAKYAGTGAIAASDYKDIKWVGKTKGGQACTIKITDAINMENIDWTMAEKDDVVAAVTFTATYSNTDGLTADMSTAEPWEVEVAGSTAPTGAAAILLGVGILYLGTKAVGLSRGGGSFSVEREFRQINADGDRGPVKDRIVMEGSIAKLTMNTLQVLDNLTDLYPGIGTVTG